MQVVNKKMCVIVILVLVIIESCTLFLMYKSYSNKNTNLDEVNLNISNSNMFAIMLEQEDGTYKEDNSNTWPTDGYTYNASMSGCIDINGNKLDGVLSYDATNNIATVDTGNTSYCYLYFSKPKSAPGTMLEGKENITFTLEGGLYRYQGTQVEVDNNYICFGTSDKNECTNDKNTYMYRIIGVTSDNKLKLIKKETYEDDMTNWGCATGIKTNSFIYLDNGDNNWNESSTYVILNGINVSPDLSFVNGSLYPYMATESEWYNMIEYVDWKYGRTFNYTMIGDYSASSIYEIENGFTDSVNAKIGLMYIHDYYYAYPGGNPGNASNAKTSWIHLSHNDKEFSYCDGSSYLALDVLITQSDYDDDDNLTFQFAIKDDGTVVGGGIPYVVRPVFYLKSAVEITGAGTIDDPYIIN
ncbi:MAG: hypothetical protein IJN13_03425 [Bacilli bacterium]|nr:hypothetical protein [Bacilli bacterium]